MSKPTAFSGPVFLIGMPRSGTKLLRELLNRHPDVRIPGIETEFLPYLIAHAAQFGDLSCQENFHRLYRHLLNFPYFIYRRDEGRLVSEAAWRAACPSYDVAGLFEGLVRVDTDSTVGSTSVWGDKSPSYIQHLTSIKAIYPAARFIHIVRDVRDQCLSSRKAWGKDMLRAAERWGRGVLAARNAGQAMGRDYLEVRYEDLLDAPEATMRRLCDFIGVAFHEDMTRLARTAENLGDAAGETRVVASNKGKFMTAMNARTRLRVEELAFEAMQVFGYAFTEARGPGRLPGWERRIRQLLDAISLLRFEARKRGVLGALRFRLGYFLVTRRV